jgi:hypothetical protein
MWRGDTATTKILNVGLGSIVASSNFSVAFLHINLYADTSKSIIKEWRDAGERKVLVIDIIGHLLHNNLYSQLKD